MGSAGFIAGCLMGTSVIFTVIMAIVSMKTIPTKKESSSGGGGTN